MRPGAGVAALGWANSLGVTVLGGGVLAVVGRRPAGRRSCWRAPATAVAGLIRLVWWAARAVLPPGAGALAGLAAGILASAVWLVGFIVVGLAVDRHDLRPLLAGLGRRGCVGSVGWAAVGWAAPGRTAVRELPGRAALVRRRATGRGGEVGA